MSATILTVIVLIVMWVVVLVPLLVRRAEDTDENASLWAPAITEPAAGATEYADAATHHTADTRQRQYADGQGREHDGERGRPGDALAADRSALRRVSVSTDRAATLTRRRRVLGILAALAIATATAALLSAATFWLANALCDALLLGYLGKLRADARRQAQRSVRQRPPRHPRAHIHPLPAAPARRPSRPIALDDEDPYFAQLDVRYSRAANE